jgi:large subunit ribosomal protein L19
MTEKNLNEVNETVEDTQVEVTENEKKEEVVASKNESKSTRRKGKRKKKESESKISLYEPKMNGVEEDILSIAKKYIKKDIPDFKAGDTVKVHIKIPEKKVVKGKVKESVRIQIFEGFVLRRNSGQLNETFTVRKISHHGVGVEKTFPLHSPVIDKVEIVKSTKVRRARLYYMRDRIGKAASL